MPSSVRPPPTRPPSVRWKRLIPIVQVVVLAVLLVLFFRFFDREQISLALESVSLPLFLVFLILMFTVRVITAYRWWVVAEKHVGLSGLTYAYVLRVDLLADFGNIWMQSLVGGEAIRVWKIIQRTGEKTLGPATVVLDRVVGTASLVLVCLPLLVVLIIQVPTLSLPERFPLDPRLVAGGAAVALLAVLLALRYVEALRSLARQALQSVLRSRFMIGPLLISVASYPAMIAAYYLGVQELAERGLLVTAMVAVLPRLGRAIPLSIFGVTAVEGATLAIGALLEVSPQVLFVVAALNVTSRYINSILGVVAEISVGGTRFFSQIRDGELKS